MSGPSVVGISPQLKVFESLAGHRPFCKAKTLNTTCAMKPHLTKIFFLAIPRRKCFDVFFFIGKELLHSGELDRQKSWERRKNIHS